MRPLTLILALLSLSSTVAQSQQPLPTRPGNNSSIPRSDAPTPPPIPLQFNSGFAGHWTGTLAYRDYKATTPDAPHTTLPTQLTATSTPDGRAVNLLYTYDDGMGKDGKPKIVTERTILAFTGDTALLTGTTNAENQSFHVEGTEAFAKQGLGTLILTGPGKENDHPVDTRVTLTLTPTRLTWLTETRPAHTEEAFVFRHQYTLTRTPDQTEKGRTKAQ